MATEFTHGKIVPVALDEEMKRSYIDYAMSVIVSRALPDVRDGLKPVHRRILYAMRDLGMLPNRPHLKSARAVGEVIGKYHPHGEGAVYDAIVRLAQDFSMRYPLVDGHGNFGSVDGDPPAAMRYCVTGDALVVTDRGLVRIDRLSPDGREAVALRVLSARGAVNGASKWFDCGPFPTRRVRTRRGYEITGTPNHPLLTCVAGDGGRPALAWKTIGEIRPGDWLVLDRSDALWPHEEVRLEAFHPNLPARSRVRRHPLPARLDEDLGFLLGALVAEGTFRQRVVEFTSVAGELADAFEAAWERVLGACRLHVFERQAVGYGRRPFLQMQVVSTQAVRFLRNLGLNSRWAGREVPEAVLRSPRPVVAAFLRGLFEGAGAVERSGRSLLRVGMQARSKTLLRQVQTLLLRFGIVSTVSTDARRDIHRLTIVGRENIEAFAEKIGFVSAAKRRALEGVVRAHTGRALSRADLVPFLARYVRQTAGRGQRVWLGKHNFERPGRLAAAPPRITAALPAADAALIQDLAASRYLFEQVAEVEDAGVQPVYSLRVDSPCHSFVANGFVNHNTEVRLTPLALEMLADLDKDTVDFQPNFDDKELEPAVLPARFPNLLANGTAGIAVGMATNIPPHNLGEVIDACVKLIDHPETTNKELMQVIKGPDFPTGGLILGRDGIREAYETGRGIIRMRGVARIEELSGGRMRILITELPYQVNKAKLIERIAELARDKKLEGIADLRDESDREGVRIAVELKRDANPHVLLNQLYKFTQLQETFGVIMLALVHNQPRVLDLRGVLWHYIEHQKDVVVRRTRHELSQAEERAHILEGLKKALDHLDAVIALIRASRTPDEARTGLMEQFGLSEKQAQAILDMRLQRLTQLERAKIDEEYQELLKTVEYLRAVLASERMVFAIVKKELTDVAARFRDPRRTRIVAAVGDFDVEDLIAEEDVVITLTHRGYVKRVPMATYRSQRRGGRGITGAQAREEDFVEQLFITTTHHWMLFFTNLGKVYRLKAHEVPEAGRYARGTAIVNLLPLDREERVETVIPIREYGDDRYLFFATRRGFTKKTALTEYDSPLKAGLIAIRLEGDDELVGVRLTDGTEQVILVTRHGQAVVFPEDEVRPMGRATRGVIGVRLDGDDAVVAMDTVQAGGQLLVITDRGYGKRTPIEEYRVTGRPAKGVRTIKLAEAKGKGMLVGARVVKPGDEVMIITAKGIIIRTPVEDIPVRGRATEGNIIIRLGEDDEVVALARVVAREEA